MSELRIRNKGLRKVRVSDILDNEHNYRTHPTRQKKAFDETEEALGFFGYPDVHLTDDGKYKLIDGELRKYHLIEKYGEQTKIQVNVTDFSEAEARAALLTKDPLAALAGVNEDALKQLAGEVHDDFSHLVQFTASSLHVDLSGLLDEIEEDEAPEPPKKPITKPGTLWKLGDHRLLCGDSAEPGLIGKLMNEKAVLMATDPPYGVSFKEAKYNPRAKAWEGIEGDELRGDTLRQWLKRVVEQWLTSLVDSAAFYFWTAAMAEGAAAAAALQDVGLHIQSQIIWAKNALVLGQADYQWRHENCWYAYRKKHGRRWKGGRSQTTIWEISKVANALYEHPNQKPVELYAIPICNHTDEGELVCDPFVGSGTQIIAAEQLNRRCFAMEIAPEYCDVTVERWQNLTGKKAKRG